jgi:hypothetical protein
VAFIQDQEHKSQLIESIKREIAKGTTRQQCKDKIFSEARPKLNATAAMINAFFETDLLIDQVYDYHETLHGSEPGNPDPITAPASIILMFPSESGAEDFLKTKILPSSLSTPDLEES